VKLHHRLWIYAILASSCFLSATRSLRAEDDDLVKAWLAVSNQMAQNFVIAPTEDLGKPFFQLDQPVFRHSQPARGNDIGAIWLWVDGDQRPTAIGDIFAWSINNAAVRTVTHEFHSLASVPLETRFEEATVWTPRQPGLQWTPVPNAPVPAESKLARQRQARELTQRFAANSVDFRKGRWELRVVPKAVHQFEIEPPKETQCGSLFAVCQGTDPELWLALETQKTSEGYRWHYALASFTDYSLQVRLDDTEVWSCPQYPHGVTDQPHWVQSAARMLELPKTPKSE